MDLRHLRYFVTVAETLNFSQAARQLRIAQPPLSVQVRSLEAELGVQLFERSSRGVALTPAGCALLPAARDTLAAAQRASDAARAIASGKTGLLRFGLISPAATPEIAARLKKFHCACDRSRWPHSTVCSKPTNLTSPSPVRCARARRCASSRSAPRSR